MRPSFWMTNRTMRAPNRALLAVPVAPDQRDHRVEVLGTAEVGHLEMAAPAATAGRQAEPHALGLGFRDARALLNLFTLRRPIALRVLGLDLVRRRLLRRRLGRLDHLGRLRRRRTDRLDRLPGFPTAAESCGRRAVATPPSFGPIGPPRLICMIVSGCLNSAPNHAAGRNTNNPTSTRCAIADALSIELRPSVCGRARERGLR